MTMKIPGVGAANIGVEGLAQGPASKGSDFMKTLEKTMQKVESLQGDAENQVESLVAGQAGDVHSAMIAVEKASLSFELMMQVRNKLVQAYEDISRMTF